MCKCNINNGLEKDFPKGYNSSEVWYIRSPQSAS